jgi:tRNA pseudouridine55 synthase
MTAAPAEGGLLLIDKPEGPTSHDVVAGVRRKLGVRRIGHTGTLDPFASGLLLLCVGPATRLVEYFHRLPKTYQATLQLGTETDSHDRTGDIVSVSDAWTTVSRPDCERAMAEVCSRRWQTPPAFSAKRRHGRRAYEAARSGRKMVLDPVEVEVSAFRVAAFESPTVRVEVTVSTGTYVRALARDVGRELGCGAHLTSLRRTRIGPFQVSDAVPPEEAAPETGNRGPWRAPAEAVAEWLPSRELDPAEVRRVRTGQPVSAGQEDDPAGREDDPVVAGTPVALLADGRLVAIAERQGDELRPRKVWGAS